MIEKRNKKQWFNDRFQKRLTTPDTTDSMKSMNTCKTDFISIVVSGKQVEMFFKKALLT